MTLLGRCLLMDAILLCEDKALIRVEPDDAFYPLNEFGILQVPDKLKILSLVEDQLQNSYELHIL